MDRKIDKIKSLVLSIPGISLVLGKLGRNFEQPPLPILAYHRVFPFDPVKYPFDDGIISAIPDRFDRQMAFISKNFNVLNFRDILDLTKNGNPVPQDGLVITFDDGYRDNYQFAFPILRKYGLTAVIFPSTAYIGSREVFWFEKVSYYIKQSVDGPVHIESLDYHSTLRYHNKKDIITEILHRLKNVPNALRLTAIAELDSLYGREGIRHRELVETLSWNEILEMDKAGIEFGSHTCTHPILASMNTDEIRTELVDSKKVLEDGIGRPLISVSYPVGTPNAVNQTVEREAETAGYQFGVNYNQGINDGLQNRFSLNRIRVETDVSYRDFTAQLLFPGFFWHQ